MPTIVEMKAPTPRTPGRHRELRPGRGTGRRIRPQARPARPVAPPRLSVPASGWASERSMGCRIEESLGAVACPQATGWRLTERGIALVLATGLAIAAAALVVVTLTALRVTSDAYVSTGQLTAEQR